MTSPGPQRATARVWDLPIRLFHWALVALLGVQWWSGAEGRMDIHTATGPVVLAVVLFRIIWGFVGGRHARFANFIAGPGRVLAYVRRLLRGDAAFILGHNPLGGWMILALLAVLLVQAGTGLFANDDIFTEGPLAHLVSKEASDALTSVHKSTFPLLLVLVALHVAAALYYLIAKRDNLIRAMVTGRKPLPPGQCPPPADPPRPVRFVLSASVAGLIVWYAVTQV